MVPTATRGDDFFENFNMGGGWSLSIQNIILQTFVVVGWFLVAVGTPKYDDD